jgi:hypothetical protein
MNRQRQPSSDSPDEATVRYVVALIEDRIRELDRHGPPNAPGHGCVACKDAELHRLVAVLKAQGAR